MSNKKDKKSRKSNINLLIEILNIKIRFQKALNN